MSTGYLDRRSIHPRTLATAVAIHLGILAAILTVRPSLVSLPVDKPLTIDPIPIPVPPPPVEHVRPLPKQRVQQPIAEPQPLVPPPPPIDLGPVPIVPGPTVDLTPVGEVQPKTGNGTDGVRSPAPPVPAPPVLTNPGVDPRYARDLQPPYPPAMERLEQEGTVTVRVQIGADGRVIDVELVRTDADEFFAATKAWALRKWRFRPATSDGAPVVGWLTKTMRFQINR